MREFFIEHENVEITMQEYFSAVYRADIETLERLFHPNARIFGYLGPNLITGAPEIFFNDLASQPSMQEQAIECRCIFKDVQVTEQIARVTLLVDGFFGKSCVEDHFHLIQQDNQWKIVSKTFTSID